MKVLSCCLLVASAIAAAQTPASMSSMPMSAGPAPGERLGTVSFPVSCSAAVQAPFNRGVALLHDFWYGEARPQFERISKTDPQCAIAHWGIAMSVFHQIWNRPSEKDMNLGREEIGKAVALNAGTAREREYIAALGVFYKAGSEGFEERVKAYSDAMEVLYKHNPDDVDAGAFYALSLLGAKGPNDTSLTNDHKAMTVLTPLIARYPDNPGLVHYIIHACDNPAMAKDGLAAAQHYGEIAQSGAHAVHMSGHIFARLGMWPEDIESQTVSIEASEAAEARHMDGLMDEPHSYDFLMYAEMQSGRDADAKAVFEKIPSVLGRIEAMQGMGTVHMPGMVGRYRTSFPVFYALERRDWKAAAALEPVSGAIPESQATTWWARAVADGHLHRAAQAEEDLTHFDALVDRARKEGRAYNADSTGARIMRGEIVAWGAFAAEKNDKAVQEMRAAAELQDKVGQGEVDIPAREMLGDMLLELHQPKEALAEYRVALRLSPNRFNGLYHAGMAAEEAGDKGAASGYYAALLHATGDGAHSSRAELVHARSFVSAGQSAMGGAR